MSGAARGEVGELVYFREITPRPANTDPVVAAAGDIACAVGPSSPAVGSYEELGAWNQTGWGDSTVALKTIDVNGTYFKMAHTAGFVAPTGRTDSPSILTDLPFGDGLTMVRKRADPG